MAENPTEKKYPEHRKNPTANILQFFFFTRSPLQIRGKEKKISIKEGEISEKSQKSQKKVSWIVLLFDQKRPQNAQNRPPKSQKVS